MSLGMSICFYLLIGITVTAALWLSRDTSDGSSDVFQILTAPFFWPIYLPLLLVRRADQINPLTESTDVPASTSDDMTVAIEQVERELDTALQSLSGWAETVLADEQHRIAELKNAWRQQADHIRELDKLLAQSPTEDVAISPEPVGTTSSGSTIEQNDRQSRSRFSKHERVRSENILRLKQLRTAMFDDMMASIAWVRELATMIHLAKYTGAPASRAEELVRQIAAAVEGLSEANRMTSSSQA